MGKTSDVDVREMTNEELVEWLEATVDKLHEDGEKSPLTGLGADAVRTELLIRLTRENLVSGE